MSAEILARAAGLGPGQAAAAVGGGGKTSLLGALARECHAAGWRPALITTTTKIFAPRPEEKLTLLLGDAPTLADRVSSLAGRGPIALARRRIGEAPVPGDAALRRMKLDGFGPEEAECLRPEAGVLLIEADGSRGLPIKAPGEDEPVVPRGTDLVLGVVGLDALGAPLDEAHAFRPERLGRLVGLASGERIGPEAIGRLAAHPEGLFRGAPPGARRLIVVNKADLGGSVDNLEEIGYIIWETAGAPKGPAGGLLFTSCLPPESRVVLQIPAGG